MTVRRGAVRRSPRAPLPQRSRKRWTVTAGVTVCWAVLLVLTGSVFGATLLLAVLAGLGIVGVLVLKATGVTRDHPWVRRVGSPPGGAGQEVVRLGPRPLPHL